MPFVLFFQKKIQKKKSKSKQFRFFFSILVFLYMNRPKILEQSWQLHKFNFLLKLQMPVFFLLSGFCLTLGYGKKKYTRSTLCCGSCQTTSGCDCRPCRKQPDSSDEIFDSWEFYFGRISRILPVYYLCLLLAIPLIPLGSYWFAPTNLYYNIGGVVSAIFLVQTWIFHFWFGPVGSAWTVSTLFFFYIVFPR